MDLLGAVVIVNHGHSDCIGVRRPDQCLMERNRQLDLPFLSIIIPAYNEESRLPHTLAQVLDFIHDQPFESEVLVVENGSQDRTLQIAQEFAASHSGFLAIHEPERGKGRAVKRGMLEAGGKFRFMCDADLSMPVHEIPRFLPPQLVDYDIAIASREASGAVRYHEPAYRHFGGRLINWMIRLLALPDLQDTQCGFKCLRDDGCRGFVRQPLLDWLVIRY